jgi:hypothetical protein
VDLTDLAIRAGAVALIGPWLVELIKLPKCAAALQDSKALTRLVALVVLCLGAFVADWLPDGAVTLKTWLPVVLLGAPAMEASYAWIVKALTGAVAARKAGA